VSNNEFLPYGRQFIDEGDIEAVSQVLTSPFLTTGPPTLSFEKSFAEETQSLAAVSCANGTAGLHIAMLALGIGPGDWVIVPSITFLASANAARYVGADVIFCDVDETTGLMTGELLKQAIEKARSEQKNIKAVIPVHFAGQLVNMADIAEIARSENLLIVEDACHALGGEHPDPSSNLTPVGSCAWSDMTVFSLHPVKTITMGEGGVVTTGNAEFAEKLQLVKNHGMVKDGTTFKKPKEGIDKNGQPYPWYYEMQDTGFNYRASNLNCALGESQLQKLKSFVDKRRDLVAHYDDLFASNNHIRPLARTDFGNPSWHLYVVLIDFDSHDDRADLMRALAEKGIGTQVHYIPVHMQPYYEDLYGQETLIGAETFYKKCLSIPLYPELETSNLDFVAETVAELRMK